MKLRHKYLIAGGVWALLLGLGAALGTVAYAAGASWLWGYGDDPWPDYISWVIPVTAFSVGTGAALAIMALAWRHGQEREAMSAQEGEGLRLLGLTVVPIVLLAAGGLVIWAHGHRVAEARVEQAHAHALFEVLARDAHRIAWVDMRADKAGTVRASVMLKGARVGGYRFGWRVSDSATGTALIEGDRILSLSPGEHVRGMGFELNDIAGQYQHKILKGAGGVLVEEPFRLEVFLTPQLTEDELATLPQAEQWNLAHGESSLQSKEEARFPVRFTISADGFVLK